MEDVDRYHGMHTQECFDYAIKTMGEINRAYCIISCADARTNRLNGPKVMWCEEHATRGGVMRCAKCSLQEMSHALESIDTIVDTHPANDGTEHAVCTYDVDPDPEGVVQRVRIAIDKSV